jgi:hypothetical protein
MVAMALLCLNLESRVYAMFQPRHPGQLLSVPAPAAGDVGAVLIFAGYASIPLAG